MNGELLARRLTQETLSAIQASPISLADFLRTLDVYEWQELLDATCSETPIAYEVFVARPGELTAAMKAALNSVSEETRSVATRALVSIIRRWSTAAADSGHRPQHVLIGLHIAYSCRLRFDAALAFQLISDEALTLDVRRAALALLTFLDPSHEVWARLRVSDVPEFATVVAARLSGSDPSAALSALVGLKGGVEELTLARALGRALRSTPREAVESVTQLIDSATPFTRPVLVRLLESDEFRQRFRKAELATFPHLTPLRTTTEFEKLVRSAISRNGDVWHRYSGYYDGSMFGHSAQKRHMPEPIQAVVAETMRRMDRQARALSILPEGLTFISVRKPVVPLDSLVDDILACKIVQSDPVFGSAKRLSRAAMLAVGTVDVVSILAKRNVLQTFSRVIAAPSSHERDRYRLSTILRACVEQGYACIVQPSTAIAEELASILESGTRETQWASSVSSEPLSECSDPYTIGAALIARRTGHGKHAVAVVDTLIAEEVRREHKRQILRREALFDEPIPVGYLIPAADEQYGEVLHEVVGAALRDDKKGTWERKFVSLMEAAGVRLFEDGPRFIPMKGMEDRKSGTISATDATRTRRVGH